MKNAVSDDASDVRNRTHSVILEELASHWIALDGRARIIIDPSLTIFWINQPAVRLLARDPALGIAGDRIAEGPGRSAIKDLQGRVDAGVAYAIVQFVNGDGNYLLNAYRLIRGNTHVCIEIQVDCAEFIPRYADFGRVFRLTRTEIEIVDHMLNGLNVIEIAHGRLVSVDTIRSHIRGIYEKVGVTSREQLFSRLRRFQIT